jgi:ssRNA-specific RNase YbeY (16S rRNA maturation enzyme)
MDNKINKNSNLLIEFFSEEIPARMQVQSGINLENLCKKAFNFRGISFGDIDFSGDIAITESYVLKNGNSSSQSFFMLMVHGMLHLFKYSHYDKDNRETMRMLENICMINLGLKKTHEV